MKKKTKSKSVAHHMAEKKQIPASSNPHPEVMKMADEVRSKANAMPDRKREESFSHGMRLIYGGSSHVAAKTGRA